MSTPWEEEQPPEWFTDMPYSLQLLFAQMGWAGARESWLTTEGYAHPGWETLMTPYVDFVNMFGFAPAVGFTEFAKVGAVGAWVAETNMILMLGSGPFSEQISAQQRLDIFAHEYGHGLMTFHGVDWLHTLNRPAFGPERFPFATEAMAQSLGAYALKQAGYDPSRTMVPRTFLEGIQDLLSGRPSQGREYYYSQMLGLLRPRDINYASLTLIGATYIPGLSELFAGTVQLGQEVFGGLWAWLGAGEDEYPGAMPTWARWASLARGLGYLAPALKIIPFLGDIPLIGTLAPSYMYGMFQEAYRAGFIPPFLGGEEWTYAGKMLSSAELAMYHQYRIARQEAYGYESSAYRQGALALAQARVAYWGWRQEWAPAAVSWSALRLASFAQPDMGVIRAFGWAFMGPIMRGLSGLEMMPHMQAAYQTSDPAALARMGGPPYTYFDSTTNQFRTYAPSPAFWPFQGETLTQTLIPGVVEWTGIQMVAMGLPALLRPGLDVKFGGYAYEGFGGKPGGMPVIEAADKSRWAALFQALKPVVPWGFMQAGLGLMVDPLMQMSLVYRMTEGKTTFLTPEQMWSSIGQIAAGATLFGVGAYVGYGPPHWARPSDLGVGGYLGIQFLALQGLTAASLIAENFLTPWLKEQPIYPVFHEFRRKQLETYTQVMGILAPTVGPAGTLALERWQAYKQAGGVRGLIGGGMEWALTWIYGARGGTEITAEQIAEVYGKLIRDVGVPEHIASHIQSMIVASPQYAKEVLAGRGGIIHAPGIAESIIWGQIGPRISAFFGGLERVQALGWGVYGGLAGPLESAYGAAAAGKVGWDVFQTAYGARRAWATWEGVYPESRLAGGVLYNLLDPLAGAGTRFLQGIYGEAARFAGELGAPSLAEEFRFRAEYSGAYGAVTGAYKQYGKLRMLEMLRLAQPTTVEEAYAQYGTLRTWEALQIEQQQRWQNLQQLAGPVLGGFWQRVGMSPFLRGYDVTTLTGIYGGLLGGLTRTQLEAMIASGQIPPDLAAMLKMPTGTTDIFAAMKLAGVSEYEISVARRAGWTGMGIWGMALERGGITGPGAAGAAMWEAARTLRGGYPGAVGYERETTYGPQAFWYRLGGGVNVEGLPGIYYAAQSSMPHARLLDWIARGMVGPNPEPELFEYLERSGQLPFKWGILSESGEIIYDPTWRTWFTDSKSEPVGYSGLIGSERYRQQVGAQLGLNRLVSGRTSITVGEVEEEYVKVIPVWKEVIGRKRRKGVSSEMMQEIKQEISKTISRESAARG